MKELIFDPEKTNRKMRIVCFVSGSGTNYREITKRNAGPEYFVFTNRPDCGGAQIAAEFGHRVISLSHIPYLREARKNYGAGNVPRNCPQRLQYDMDVGKAIEEAVGGRPDLICLAGYDQWTTDWLVDRYYPRILNVHPGDTTKGYFGLYWVPTARALLAGDEGVRSTLFFVDKGKDTGPVLAQSAALNMEKALQNADPSNAEGLADGLKELREYAAAKNMRTYEDFRDRADSALKETMEKVCRAVQDELKMAGDWEIYPFGVHELIGKGLVAVDGRDVYVSGKKLPPHGFRPDEK